MNEATKSAVPVWYWVIATVALLWNLLGCTFFALEMFAQEAMIESWPDAHKEWARSLPSWTYFVYGVAVATGVAGSIGLLMRKSWSVPIFAISLVAVIVQMVYTMIIAGGLETMGPSALIMPAVVMVIAAALLMFAWLAHRRGWLGRA